MYLTDSVPAILVFAGPNGAGKSTVTENIPMIGYYVNADEIKKNRHCTDVEAAKRAETIRNRLIEEQKSFTFETVLSTDRNLDLLRRAKDFGYRIFAVFVITKDSSINVARVQLRVKAGGHDVPPGKTVSRYEKSLKNLQKLVRIADETRIIDNTGDSPDLMCEVCGQNVKIWPTAYWTKKEILALLAHNQK